MIRRLALALLLALLAGGATAQQVAASEAAASASPRGPIKVVLDDNYPPYVLRNADGSLAGLLPDLWALWSQQTGVAVELQAMDWAAAQAHMRAGSADVIDTIFVTDERRRLYDFSTPYATIDVPIYFHESVSGIANAESLKGFTVGVKEGDACIDTLRARGIETLKTWPSYAALVDAARAGEVRVFCMDAPPANYLLQRTGADAQFRHSLPLYSGAFHRAVHKGQTALLAMVERGFAQIPAAQREAVEAKWFGRPVAMSLWTRHQREILGGVLAIGVLVAVLAAWTTALRRRVSVHTAELDAARLAAEQAHEQLDAMLDAIPDLLFEVDAQGRYFAVRTSREDLLANDPSQLIGRHVSDVLPPEQTAIAMAALDEAVRTGRSQGRQFSMPLPGGARWFEMSIARKRGAPDEPPRLVVLSRDITARKDAELALQQSEHRFRQFFEAGLVGMSITDAQRCWIHVNARLCDMFGYSEAELRAHDWDSLTHPDDRDEGRARFDAVLSGEIDGYTLDKRYVRKDGSVLDAAIAVRCERDAEGRAQRFYAIVEDVSARKRAERALAAHSEQLEALVEARSRELVLARDQAQAASRAKSELLSRMSHELRTPMNAILGFSQLLEVDRGLPPNARRFVTEIMRAGKHLLSLINDVLDLAHVESGRLSLSPEPLALTDFVPEVLTLMRPLADRRGVSLTLEPIDGLVVRADRTRLKQVLVNLVSNAIKYNRDDGQVAVAAWAQDDTTLRLVVRDTGPGIPAERAKSLFEPFNRLGAESGTIEGTGIGLSICHRLVELMGGRIGVEQPSEGGSEFWVDLPRAAPGTEPAEPPPAPPPPVAPAPLDATVLCVEDNPANLRLMAHVIGRIPGLRLLQATSAEEGITLAREHRPGLILLDINLPGMDGYAALDVLRADARTRHIPAVALTANAMSGDARRAVAAGFAEHVAKPIDLPAFEAMVRRLVDAGRAVP